MRLLMTMLLVVLAHTPSRAEVPLDGQFTATRPCPADQSISRGTNPGNVTLSPGTRYALVAANKTPATHLRIVIPGAAPDRRWVDVTCGETDAAITQPASAQPATTSARTPRYILAVNWQPAFCETAPRTRECRNQRPDSFEATNFTLHGLWPQPRGNEYCGVSDRDIWASRDGRWLDLPMLHLTIAQRRDLDTVMPGSQSGLDRHEWTKHGTCYGAGQRDYFRDSIDLTLALNASPVADLFATNIGRRLTLAEIRAAFDAAFGPGAGERVDMDCEADGNRTLITELRIALSGEITGPDDLGPLILAADPVESDCRSGQVDAVGLR